MEARPLLSINEEKEPGVDLHGGSSQPTTFFQTLASFLKGNIGSGMLQIPASIRLRFPFSSSSQAFLGFHLLWRTLDFWLQSARKNHLLLVFFYYLTTHASQRLARLRLPLLPSSPRTFSFLFRIVSS